MHTLTKSIMDIDRRIKDSFEDENLKRELDAWERASFTIEEIEVLGKLAELRAMTSPEDYNTPELIEREVNATMKLGEVFHRP